jgi:peptide-methionine (S)-S-oxide reductase
VFKELRGVTSVRSGYAGDSAATANYRAVCSGSTNHAEVIEVRYDASQTTFGQLLKIHFSVAHDPTQLDGQGNDLGRQYRSAIFYSDEEQKRVAEAYIRQLNEARVFHEPIVTTLEPLREFYAAEEYHQDYAARNPNQPYIAYVAAPKVEKLRENFAEKLKR